MERSDTHRLVTSICSDLSLFSQFPEPLGVGMDFHFRFTKFCLSTYMIRTLSIGRGSMDNDQPFRLNNSVQAAHHFCELLLNAGPAERDGARYTGDFGFVMISFSSLFILEACKLYPAAMQNSDHILTTVEEIALFIKELAVNSNHGPYLQGNIILQKLHELDRHRQVDPGHSEAQVTPFSFEPGHVEGFQGFMMDPIWDMLNFFPDVHEP